MKEYPDIDHFFPWKVDDELAGEYNNLLYSPKESFSNFFCELRIHYNYNLIF
jgi:hypothetical protein